LQFAWQRSLLTGWSPTAPGDLDATDAKLSPVTDLPETGGFARRLGRLVVAVFVTHPIISMGHIKSGVCQKSIM